MEAHILLADAAQADQAGKIHALGLGWSTTTTPLPPQAVIILIKVPWSQANRPHKFAAELLDADGQPVAPPGQDQQPIKIAGDFEAGRPPGLPPGSPLDIALAVAISGGLAVPVGRYTWKLSIDGSSEDAWSASFLVRMGVQPGTS